MAWQELLTSSQDITQDRDGYVHFTRTFRITGGNPRNFFGNGTGPAPFLSIPILNVGQTINGTVVTPQFLPDYGHVMNVGAGPSFVGTSDGGNGLMPVSCFLHDYQLRPGAAHFDAIAYYTNDMRISPLGVSFSSGCQQSMVSIPYARRVPLVFGEGVEIKYGFSESYFQTPMEVESISHTVHEPRSQLKFIENAIEQHAKQLHLLPFHPDPVAFLGADIRMQGPQWLEVSYQWQWQQGVFEVSSASPKTYGYSAINNGVGGGYQAFPNANMIVPGRISPLLNFGAGPYTLPPYHTVDMRFEVAVNGNELTPRWYYQCPFEYVPQGWQGLVGSSKFIWRNP